MFPRSGRCCALAAAALLFTLTDATPAAAQQTASGNRGRISFVGGIDFANTYMFRGLRRDDTRVIIWPFVEGIARLHSDPDGGVTSVTLHVGTWNSIHTGVTGLQSTTGKMWYESDFYSTVRIGFGGLAVGATYTSYMSPSFSFDTIKELSFKVAEDEELIPEGLAIKPYGLLAFELDTIPRARQADRGLNAGTYLELGAAPGWYATDLQIAIPVKVGLSLDDYYELGAVDHTFGFLSLGAVATLPFAQSTNYGTWNVHGGIEFLSLGDTPEAFNGGDQTKLVFSVGIGFSY